MTRWTAEDIARLPADIRAQAHAKLQGPRSPGKTGHGGGPGEIAAPGARESARKYRNEPVEWNGQRFDSRFELQVYREYAAEVLAGRLRAVVRQVSLPLPGSTRRIRVDFLLVENGGRVRFADAKGWETEAWRSKRQQVREAYGIDIELRARRAKGAT